MEVGGFGSDCDYTIMHVSVHTAHENKGYSWIHIQPKQIEKPSQNIVWNAKLGIGNSKSCFITNSVNFKV